jgi:anti-sigma factor RsiW
MKPTRDVVKDLVTVYLAGDASADTRAFVEEWLKTDPDLAKQVEEARRADLPPVSLPQPSVEKQALTRTRRQLRLRALVLGMAIYVSTLPLSITFNRAGFHGLLIDNWPERVVLLSLAAVLWVVYFRLARRMRASGL